MFPSWHIANTILAITLRGNGDTADRMVWHFEKKDWYVRTLLNPAIGLLCKTKKVVICM